MMAELCYQGDLSWITQLAYLLRAGLSRLFTTTTQNILPTKPLQVGQEEEEEPEQV